MYLNGVRTGVVITTLPAFLPRRTILARFLLDPKNHFVHVEGGAGIVIPDLFVHFIEVGELLILDTIL